MPSRTYRILSPFVVCTTFACGLWGLFGISITLSAEPPATLNPSAIPLEQVQQVLVETLSLTERGLQDSTAIQQVVSERLARADFTPVSDANAPHDIIVRVKCEERKTWAGPSKHRTGSHPSAVASRLWKGPACHISYRYQGKPALWSWEVRTPFEDPREAAKAAGATNSGPYALQELQAQLAQDDFPLYLAAEWGQVDRLISLYQQATDQLERRRLILQLLGALTSPAALATIKEATTNPELGVAAIAALGDQGEVAVPILANILNTSQNSDHQLTALKGLGTIATHSATPILYDLFAQQLQAKDPRMQTIAVRGLGSLGDLQAIPLLETLNIQAWSNPSTHPDMEALRDALNWSLHQLDASSSSH